MKSLNLILCLCIAGQLVGCTSTGTKSTSTVIQSSVPPLADQFYVSVSEYERVSPGSCPSSSKVWSKDSLKKLADYANACFILKKSDSLESLGNHIARNYPQVPWGPYYLSLAAHLNKNFQLALWMIELTIKKSPKSAMFYYQKGRILWDYSDYAGAVAAFEAATKENPKFYEAHLLLAELNFKDQNYSKAEKYFRSALSSNPDSYRAVVGLAECEYLDKNISQAAELYERAVSLNPRSMAFRLRLAAIYEQDLKDVNQALTWYRKVRDQFNTKQKSEITFDLARKIKSLEDRQQREVSSESKLTQIDPQPQKVNK